MRKCMHAVYCWIIGSSRFMNRFYVLFLFFSCSLETTTTQHKKWGFKWAINKFFKHGVPYIAICIHCAQSTPIFFRIHVSAFFCLLSRTSHHRLFKFLLCCRKQENVCTKLEFSGKYEFCVENIFNFLLTLFFFLMWNRVFEANIHNFFVFNIFFMMLHWTFGTPIDSFSTYSCIVWLLIGYFLRIFVVSQIAPWHVWNIINACK